MIILKTFVGVRAGPMYKIWGKNGFIEIRLFSSSPTFAVSAFTEHLKVIRGLVQCFCNVTLDDSNQLVYGSSGRLPVSIVHDHPITREERICFLNSCVKWLGTDISNGDMCEFLMGKLGIASPNFTKYPDNAQKCHNWIIHTLGYSVHDNILKRVSTNIKNHIINSNL